MERQRLLGEAQRANEEFKAIQRLQHLASFLKMQPAGDLAGSD